MGIMVECRNCHNIYEAEQAWGQICPKCGSSMVGTLTGGHTIAYQDFDKEDEYTIDYIPVDIILTTGFYKTREGRKAYVSTIGCGFFACYGLVDGKDKQFHWCKDGKVYQGEEFNPDDIIGLWSEE